MHPRLPFGIMMGGLSTERGKRYVIQLSPRLAAVAGFVLPGGVLADIGTDHGYLPAALIQAGTIPRAIAADILPGPLDAARTTVQAEGLEGRVELRLGSGLQVLTPGEATTATICGMGGALIGEILAAGPVEGLQRLVLQPMGAEERLRAWLAENGWRLAAERLVEESRRIYVILAAEPGPWSPTPEELVIGPHLRAAGGPLLARYAGILTDQARRALAGARKSDRAQERVRELELRIALLEEVVRDAVADHR